MCLYYTRFPVAKELLGILRVTTEPAPMTQPEPIVTPPHIVTPPVIQQLLPIVIGLAYSLSVSIPLVVNIQIPFFGNIRMHGRIKRHVRSEKHIIADDYGTTTQHGKIKIRITIFPELCIFSIIEKYRPLQEHTVMIGDKRRNNFCSLRIIIVVYFIINIA